MIQRLASLTLGTNFCSNGCPPTRRTVTRTGTSQKAIDSIPINSKVKLVLHSDNPMGTIVES